MDQASAKPASLRWKSYAAIAFCLLVTYFGARGLIEIDSLPVWVRLAAAVAPVAVFIVCAVVFARAIRRDSDELEWRIQLEALALAFLLTFGLLLGLGLVELVVELPPDNFSYRHVWAVTPIFYFLGLGRARGRYA